MNKNLKKILVAGVALLTFASVSAGSQSNANASRNIGWRRITRATNLKVSHGKSIHLRKNQLVYVTNLAKNHKSAQIKMGRKYYTINDKLLKPSQRAKYHKAINKYKRTNQRINQKHARKYHQKRQRKAKLLVKQANKKRRHNHKRINKKNVKALKSHYRISNNAKLLKQSGFVDLRSFGPDIMNKYAPNSRKAVIPKNVNPKDVLWFQGHLMQKNPVAYAYNTKANGWVKLGD